jgi:hypothetical protein
MDEALIAPADQARDRFGQVDRTHRFGDVGLESG